MEVATHDVHPTSVGCTDARFDREEHVRTVLRSSMVAVGLSAVVLAACGKNGATANHALSDDLKRDLQLASSSDLGLASQQSAKAFPLTEIGQTSAPTRSTAPRKAAGPKAVRSKAPTVRATPEATESPEPQATVAEQSPAPAPEPTVEPSAPAVPRPSPGNPSAGAGTQGQAGGGSRAGQGDGIGAVLGTIFGAVIRGGVVDGDHCDPRSDGRHRRGPRGVYGPYSLPNSGYPSVPVIIRGAQ